MERRCNAWQLEKCSGTFTFDKPGKDPANAGNHRPVALTSHLCKWMEKIIVRRLSYYLEQRGLLSTYQALNSLNSKETIRDDLLMEIFTIMLRIQRVGINIQLHRKRWN